MLPILDLRRNLMSINDTISVFAGMFMCLGIGTEIGYQLAQFRSVSPAAASQILATESKRIRRLLKPQRRYIPYAG